MQLPSLDTSHSETVVHLICTPLSICLSLPRPSVELCPRCHMGWRGHWYQISSNGVHISLLGSCLQDYLFIAGTISCPSSLPGQKFVATVSIAVGICWLTCTAPNRLATFVANFQRGGSIQHRADPRKTKISYI